MHPASLGFPDGFRRRPQVLPCGSGLVPLGCCGSGLSGLAELSTGDDGAGELRERGTRTAEPLIFLAGACDVFAKGRTKVIRSSFDVVFLLRAPALKDIDHE